MTEKQELRAKALELAILLQGPVSRDTLFAVKYDMIPDHCLSRAKAIEKYILEAAQD